MPIKSPCKHCGQAIPDEIIEAREMIRRSKIREALSASKEIKGRPRMVDYSEIIYWREHGLSINEIADKLKISRGSVQNALQKEK